SFGGLATPEFLAMNPHGRIPVIADGETIVWESHAILRYLAARYGKERFWSDDPAVRAAVDGWMDWSHTALQPDFLVGVFWGFYRTRKGKRNGPATRRARPPSVVISENPKNFPKTPPFLPAKRLPLANTPAAPSLYLFFERETDPPPLPNVERWYRALQARE